MGASGTGIFPLFRPAKMGQYKNDESKAIDLSEVSFVENFFVSILRTRKYIEPILLQYYSHGFIIMNLFLIT